MLAADDGHDESEGGHEKERKPDCASKGPVPFDPATWLSAGQCIL